MTKTTAIIRSISNFDLQDPRSKNTLAEWQIRHINTLTKIGRLQDSIHESERKQGVRLADSADKITEALKFLDDLIQGKNSSPINTKSGEYYDNFNDIKQGVLSNERTVAQHRNIVTRTKFNEEGLILQSGLADTIGAKRRRLKAYDPVFKILESSGKRKAAIEDIRNTPENSLKNIFQLTAKYVLDNEGFAGQNDILKDIVHIAAIILFNTEVQKGQSTLKDEVEKFRDKFAIAFQMLDTRRGLLRDKGKRKLEQIFHSDQFNPERLQKITDKDKKEKFKSNADGILKAAKAQIFEVFF